MSANGYSQPAASAHPAYPGYPQPGPAPAYVQPGWPAPYPAPQAPPAPEPVDYELVKRLRAVVGGQLSPLRPGALEHQRREAEPLVISAARNAGVKEGVIDETVQAVLDLIFGAGRLQRLLNDPEIENIDCNGLQVWVSYRQRPDEPVLVDPVAETIEEFVALIRTLASGFGTASSSRPWDTANPQLDFSLPGGLRFSGVMDVSKEPLLSIRRAGMHRVFLEQLVENRTVLPGAASFLAAAVRARKNMIVCGETNSGKTTLLRALINLVDRRERLILVENARELAIDELRDLHPNAVSLEVRLANSEGAGEIDMRQLVRRSLRMNPSRVIVGEVLGTEIVEMLLAMSQGNDGSLSTIHANKAELVFDRITTYAALAHEHLPPAAVHQMIAGAVNFVVFVRMVKPGGGAPAYRCVSEIREVNGHDGTVLSSQVFGPREDGRAVARASVSCFDELVGHGYDYTLEGG